MKFTNSLNQICLYLLFCLLFIGIAGCEDFFDLFDNEDKHFPLEEKYKIKFQKGDTLTYVDQVGSTFQLVITEIKYDQRWTSRKGTNGPYNIIDRQQVNYDSAYFTPSTMPLPRRSAYSVQPDGHVGWLPSLFTIVGGGSDNKYYSEQITLNSNIYNSVYIIPRESGAPAYITTLYYSYAYGIVGFERSNGQLFSLDIP